MKRFTDRTDIAKAINGHRYPTITIDLAKADEYGLVSEPVLIDNGCYRDGFPYYIRSEVRAFRDETKFEFSSGGVCLSNSFGYYDIIDMLKYRNAPIVHTDEDVLFVIINSNTHEAYAPFLMHTGSRISPHCTTPLVFEGDNNSVPFLVMSMKYPDILANNL